MQYTHFSAMCNGDFVGLASRESLYSPQMETVNAMPMGGNEF